MRLLVVEDDARLADVLARGLREDGYAVDVAANGVDGLWRATEVDYGAVVLDAMLPDTDGFSVCRQLRQAEVWTPVLMLTARDAVQDRIRGLDSGADDYLVKPFNFGELCARLRALIRRGAVERPLALTAGDLRLDPTSKRVWRGDVEIELTAREYGLLELLMRNPDRVLSRTAVLEGNWDLGLDATSNVVDQYVAYLRRKIDRPFGVEQIETVRGLGYRLSSNARQLR